MVFEIDLSNLLDSACANKGTTKLIRSVTSLYLSAIIKNYFSFPNIF